MAKKLGIKEGFRVCFVGAPPGFENELELPANVRSLRGTSKPLDLVLFFTKTRHELKTDFLRLAQQLASNGMLWIAWPKKASGVATDLSENIVRQIGLDAGFVDVKVCAVDEIWSGLKFVYRLQDRGRIPA